DPKKGALATVIVQQGTLKVRQDVVADEAEGRVKSLINERGAQLNDVTPGSPAEIVGFKEAPSVGSTVRDAGAEYDEVGESAEEATSEVSLGSGILDIFNETLKLKLIVKADVKGTLEAITQTLDPESVELLASGIGPV